MNWNLLLLMLHLSLTSIGLGLAATAPTGVLKFVGLCLAVANALLAAINIWAYRRAQHRPRLRVTLGIN